MFRRMSSAIIKESFKNVPLVSLRLLVKVGLAVVTDQPGGSNGFIHTASFLSGSSPDGGAGGALLHMAT